MLKENTNCHELLTNYSYNINVRIMKRKYDKPTMCMVKIQHQQHLLQASNQGYEVIGTGEPNQPAGAREFNGIDWDDWDE